MGHYTDFKAKDFALNESFQKWVLSPDDEAERFWSEWMADNPHKRKEIDEAVKLVKLAGLSTDREANRAYLEVWENLRTNAEESINAKPVGIWSFSRYAYLAAALVGTLVISIYFLRTGNEKSIEYKTAYAEIREVVLSDGSKVILNANSSLKISGQWRGENDREVILQGEAFFTVVKTSDNKPFNVKTPSGITVQVLGTEFSVNTRRENLSVYLQSGKVKLETGNEEVILQPGERAEYDKSSRKVLVTTEIQELENDKLAWKSDLYIMNDLPLSAVARDMEDNYGVQVIVQDTTLNDRRVTAKVPARDVELLIKVLSQALEVEIERNGNQIIMR
ncbi:MAG: hypothetical protein C0490_00010 [Marivirga sp.]|nr:hypothetical protein [Marivirga sp.]